MLVVQLYERTDSPPDFLQVAALLVELHLLPPTRLGSAESFSVRASVTMAPDGSSGPGPQGPGPTAAMSAPFHIRFKIRVVGGCDGHLLLAGPPRSPLRAELPTADNEGVSPKRIRRRVPVRRSPP